MLAAMGAAFVMPVWAAAAGAAEPSGDTAAVAKASEALRGAMVAGDKKALTALVYDQLSYGHSDGHLDTKTSFIDSLAGKNAFKSLALSDQTIEVVGNNAIVRHVFDGVNNMPDGTTTTAHIKVLQVWKKEKGAWRLLARQSCPLKS